MVLLRAGTEDYDLARERATALVAFARLTRSILPKAKRETIGVARDS
jgi:hypothetical protein